MKDVKSRGSTDVESHKFKSKIAAKTGLSQFTNLASGMSVNLLKVAKNLQRSSKNASRQYRHYQSVLSKSCLPMSRLQNSQDQHAVSASVLKNSVACSTKRCFKSKIGLTSN